MPSEVLPSRCLPRPDLLDQLIGCSTRVVFLALVRPLHNTQLSPKALRSSPRDQTILVEANNKHSTTFIPRMLTWNQVTQDSKWNLQDAFEPPVEESKLLQIVEHEDGSVDLQFNSPIRNSTSTLPETSKLNLHLQDFLHP